MVSKIPFGQCSYPVFPSCHGSVASSSHTKAVSVTSNYEEVPTSQTQSECILSSDSSANSEPSPNNPEINYGIDDICGICPYSECKFKSATMALPYHPFI